MHECSSYQHLITGLFWIEQEVQRIDTVANREIQIDQVSNELQLKI
jgi:hypothetical protein